MNNAGDLSDFQFPRFSVVQVVSKVLSSPTSAHSCRLLGDRDNPGGECLMESFLRRERLMVFLSFESLETSLNADQSL